jgi:DNA polymerase-3 subunit gamma/tau
MLGAVDDAVPLELARALARRDGPALLEGCARLREAGLSASSTLEQIGQLLQRTAVEQAAPGALGDEDPLAAAARELAPLLAPDEAQLLYSIVLHGRRELGWMSDENAAFTMVLLRYLAFPPAGSGAALPARAAPLRAPAPPTIAVAAARLPSAQADDMPAADPALGDRWLVAVKPLADAGTITGLVRELAWQGQLVAIEPGSPVVWRLVVEHDALRAPGLRDKLAEALGASLSQTLRLEVDLGRPTDTPARREADERARRQQAAEATILADPDVRALLDQFKTARIVPGSIKPT